MDKKQVISLAKAENIDISGEEDIFTQKINAWLKSLQPIFGDIINENKEADL